MAISAKCWQQNFTMLNIHKIYETKMSCSFTLHVQTLQCTNDYSIAHNKLQYIHKEKPHCKSTSQFLLHCNHSFAEVR